MGPLDENGSANGRGQAVKKYGDKYEGLWYNDLPHGPSKNFSQNNHLSCFFSDA